jgi:hypothetical protein
MIEFKFTAEAREIAINRARLDVVAQPDHVERERVCGRFNRALMKPAEVEIRVQMGCVCRGR